MFSLISLIYIDIVLLASFLDDYTINYDRSTEAACRGAVDLIISYCLAELVSHLDFFGKVLVTKIFRKVGITS